MIITLKNNKFTSQIDSYGAQLISLKDNAGTEYIWQRKAPYWDECAPILFPVVGRPLNGVITVEGKDYEMALHGFARRLEFSIISQNDTVAVLSIKSTDETRKKYPYEFELIITYTLDDDGINTELKIVNTDKKEILFGVGGHPGICWPIFEGDSFDDYVIDFGKNYNITALTCSEDATILPDSAYNLVLDNGKLAVKREMFEPDAIIIDRVPFNSLKFVNKDNKGVRFEFENFKSFAMWTMPYPDEAPYLCFEPWNSMGKRKGENTNLKDKMDIVNLSEGKDFICSYKICPIN